VKYDKLYRLLRPCRDLLAFSLSFISFFAPTIETNETSRTKDKISLETYLETFRAKKIQRHFTGPNGLTDKSQRDMRQAELNQGQCSLSFALPTSLKGEKGMGRRKFCRDLKCTSGDSAVK